MSTLTITLPENVSICNGKQITFRAPCDHTNVTGIIIGNNTYELVDALNNNTTVKFVSGAMLSAIVDTENFKAYILSNAPAPYTGVVQQIIIPVNSWVEIDHGDSTENLEYTYKYIRTITNTKNLNENSIVQFIPNKLADNNNVALYYVSDPYTNASGQSEVQLQFYAIEKPTNDVNGNLVCFNIGV